MDSLLHIDNLFKKYHQDQYLAVKESGYEKQVCNKEIKKIAIQYLELTIGGVQRVISLLTSIYLEMGYEVIVIVEKLDDDLDYTLPDGVKTYVIPTGQSCFKKNSCFKRLKEIRDIIEKERVDVVCYHNASSSILLYDFMVYNQSGVNFVLIKHEYISQYMVNMSDQIYNQKSVFPLLDKVIVLGETEKIFWEHLGVKTECIYNPISDYAFGQNNGNNKNIGWIGRLSSIDKQYMDVIPIMKKVVKEIPDACLKIYGREYEKDSLCCLKDAIRQNGLEKNILYCGYVTGNMGEIYADMAVHLVTSAIESFNMTIYESKVNGVPLVLYRMPYLELLKDGKGYIAVENDDVEAAATAIVTLLKDDTLRKKLSLEAVESTKRFSNEKVKYRWKKVFDNLSASDISSVENIDIEIKNILDAMIYHHHKGCVNYQNKMKQAADKVLTEKIGMVLQVNELPIVIYPYGTIGKNIKKILNEKYQIREAFVVDNSCSCEEIVVKKLEELKTIDCSKYCFLICSNSKAVYEEIRGNIRHYVPNENILDLFPDVE